MVKRETQTKHPETSIYVQFTGEDVLSRVLADLRLHFTAFLPVLLGQHQRTLVTRSFCLGIAGSGCCLQSIMCTILFSLCFVLSSVRVVLLFAVLLILPQNKPHFVNILSFFFAVHSWCSPGTNPFKAFFMFLVCVSSCLVINFANLIILSASFEFSQ